MRSADCGSDHHLVCARIQLKLTRAKPITTPTKRYDWSKLLEPALKKEFQIALSNRFSMLDTMDNVDEEEQQISSAINDCATKLCPIVRQRTQTWISDSSLDLIDQRKQAKLVNFTRYRELSREIRQQLKAEREAYWNRVAADMEEAQQKNEFRTLYTTLWRLSGKIKPISDNIRKTDGSFVRSDTERLQRWQEFFQQLLNHQK
uniref:Uncharacterized protein n=1 Tax=Plectus sambesii TaxID=2011161 RepID=A0A914XAF4_9BILA